MSGARDGVPSDRQPPVTTVTVTEDSTLGQPRAKTREAIIRPPHSPGTQGRVTRGFGGASVFDAQADVPSA